MFKKMGRRPESIETRIDKAIKGSKNLRREKKSVICTSCSSCINFTPSNLSNRIKEHTNSESHKKNESKGGGQLTLPQIQEKASLDDTFADRLTRALCAADIPLQKLNHSEFKSFLETEMKRKIPTANALRLRHVPKISNEILVKIKAMIGSTNIYLIIDETHDPKMRFCVNTMVGPLNGKPGPAMLLNVEFVERTDNQSIQKSVMNAMKILFPDQNIYPQLHLIVSDQAAYMIKAVKELKNMSLVFPNLKHITCLCHALNLVANEIQSVNTHINLWISDCKKFLLKSNKRQHDFRMSTKLRLPPNPVQTRWGTWLNAAKYYMENFDSIEHFILNYKPDSHSEAFKNLRRMLTSEAKIIKKKLFELRNLHEISDHIRKLESRKLSSKDQLDVIEDVKILLADHPRFKLKLDQSLEKNPDLLAFHSDQSMKNLIDREYAPLVSVEVERSFSRFKNLLTAKRLNLTQDNIRHLMLINYNSFLK